MSVWGHLRRECEPSMSNRVVSREFNDQHQHWRPKNSGDRVRYWNRTLGDLIAATKC